MTLEEFEEWFAVWSEGKLKESVIPAGKNFLEALNFYDNFLGKNSTKDVRNKIAKKINNVEPKEDRDFLILKYSEYLL